MPRVKSSSSVTVPSVVAALCVSTRPAPGTDPASGVRVYESSHLIVHARPAGRWVAVHESHHTDPDRLWGVIDGHSRDRRLFYVVCPAALDSLTHTGWWDRVRDGVYTVWRPGDGPDPDDAGGGDRRRRRSHPLIVSSPPTVVGWEYRSCPYRLVDARQFGSPDLHLDGDAVGDCRRVATWVTTLMQRWLDSGCGTWRDTVGAAAWSTYTLRSVTCPLTTHDSPTVLRLEDQACHGGRAALWCGLPVGTPHQWSAHVNRPRYPSTAAHLPGPLYRLDVRGMYPAIMRGLPFPTRLVGLSQGWSVRRLSESLGCGLKVARVRIRTRRPEYPTKLNGKPAYPIGEYVTVLAEPELRLALEAKEVTQVYQVARYEAGTPFRVWGDWVLGLRSRAKRYGPPAWAAYVKAVAVALSGRLGRRQGGWADRPKMRAAVEWGEWSRVSAETGLVTRFRSLGGHVQELEPFGPRLGTLAACYSFVTSYGRAQMRRYRELCPERSVLAQHTDGLTVTADGRSALQLAGVVRPQEWGHLEEERRIECAWYRSPNHHWEDGSWTVAGIADGWTLRGDDEAEEAVTVNPVRQARSPAARAVIERVRTITLSELCEGERFGSDGWVIPPKAGTDDPDWLLG